MSNIPKARSILMEIATHPLTPPEIGQRIGMEVLPLMVRPPMEERRLTPTKSKGIDRNMVVAIKIAAQDPNLSQQEIAVRLGTNAGRVSEVLSGRRGDDGGLI